MKANMADAEYVLKGIDFLKIRKNIQYAQKNNASKGIAAPNL